MIDLSIDIVQDLTSKAGRSSVELSMNTTKHLLSRLGMDLNNFHVVQEPGYLLMVFPASLYDIEVKGNKKDYQKYIGDFTNNPDPEEIERAIIRYIWKNTDKWKLKIKSL